MAIKSDKKAPAGEEQEPKARVVRNLVLEIQGKGAAQLMEQFGEIKPLDLQQHIFGPMSKRRSDREDGEWERRIRGIMAYELLTNPDDMLNVAKNWDKIAATKPAQTMKEARDKREDKIFDLRRNLNLIVNLDGASRDQFFRRMKHRLHGAIKVESPGGHRKLAIDEQHPLLEQFDAAISRVNQQLGAGEKITTETTFNIQTTPASPKTIKFGKTWYFRDEAAVVDKSRHLQSNEVEVEVQKLKKFGEAVEAEIKKLEKDKERIIAEEVAKTPQIPEKTARRLAEKRIDDRTSQLMIISYAGMGLVDDAMKYAREKRINALWALEDASEAKTKETKEGLERFIAKARAKGEEPPEFLQKTFSDALEAGKVSMLMFSGKDPHRLAHDALKNMPPETVVVSPSISQSTGIAFAESKNIVATIVGDMEALRRHLKVIYGERSAVLAGTEDVEKLPFDSTDHVIVDTFSAQPKVIFNPNEETKRAYKRLREEALTADITRVNEAKNVAATKPSKKSKSTVIQIAGNISRPEDVPLLLSYGGTGIGLYRTEFDLLKLDRLPGPDELEELLHENQKAIAKAMKESPIEHKRGYGIVIRAIDLGGDKHWDLVKPLFQGRDPHEFRGLELLLANKDTIFLPHIRATMRTAAEYGEVDYIVPMIRGGTDQEAVGRVIAEAKAGLHGVPHKDLRAGAMIERSEALMSIPQIVAAGAKLLSFGTNDATCDILGLKPNQFISGYHDHHPAVLRMLKTALASCPQQFMDADAKEEKHMPVEVCGDMAGSTTGAVLLVGLGFKKLSTSPVSITFVRRLLTDIDLKTAQEIAEEATTKNKPEDVIALVKSRMLKAGVDLESTRYRI